MSRWIDVVRPKMMVQSFKDVLEYGSLARYWNKQLVDVDEVELVEG